MKTAMQELLSFVNSFQEETIHPRILKVKINELIEKEKMQIQIAFDNGEDFSSDFFDVNNPKILCSINYYNQNYNQNK